MNQKINLYKNMMPLLYANTQQNYQNMNFYNAYYGGGWNNMNQNYSFPPQLTNPFNYVGFENKFLLKNGFMKLNNIRKL